MNFDTVSSYLNSIKAYCDTNLAPVASQIDISDTIPETIFEGLVGLRLFAFTALTDDSPPLPDAERTSILFRCLTTIAECSPAVAKAVMDQNFGQIGMLRESDTPVAARALAQIGTGQKQAAFLMTEPQSGSNPSKFTTTFERVPGGFLITGTKDWITGAARRQLFVAVAKEAGPARNFGVFLIDRETTASDRIRVLDRKNKLGLRGLGEYRVELDHVFVPDDHVVFQPGLSVMRRVMAHYNLKRCGQAAIAIGANRAALRAAYEYLQNRFADEGGIPFQNTEFAFADLYSRAVAAEPLPQLAAERILDGDTSGVPASIAKYVCTELAVETTTRLAQLCGGNGLSDKLPLERLMRDMRMLTVAGGASEVLRATIARHLGGLLTAGSDELPWEPAMIGHNSRKRVA